jgi:hypothetical protein
VTGLPQPVVSLVREPEGDKTSRCCLVM